MTWTEMIVLYLAAGAPFCALHYFEINSERSPYVRALTSTGLLPIWIFCAVRYIVSTRSKRLKSRSSQDERIHETSKRLENVFAEIADSVSIYEFRETVERYVGLSFANQSVEPNTLDPAAPTQQDVYFEFGVSKLNNIVLARRNRKLLEFHLNDARRNLFEAISSQIVFRTHRSRSLLEELSNGLNDAKAIAELNQTFPTNVDSTQVRSSEQIDREKPICKNVSFDIASAGLPDQ